MKTEMVGIVERIENTPVCKLRGGLIATAYGILFTEPDGLAFGNFCIPISQELFQHVFEKPASENNMRGLEHIKGLEVKITIETID